jgi:hypothetical protein
VEVPAANETQLQALSVGSLGGLLYDDEIFALLKKVKVLANAEKSYMVDVDAKVIIHVLRFATSADASLEVSLQRKIMEAQQKTDKVKQEEIGNNIFLRKKKDETTYTFIRRSENVVLVTTYTGDDLLRYNLLLKKQYTKLRSCEDE